MATVCEHCNALVARTDRSVENLGKAADLLQTQSPLALWLGGSHGGLGFQLTGRAQLRHGSGGVWDEWYLAFDDGTWGWLAEAQGNFYLSYRQPDAGAIDPQSFVAGHPVQVGHPPTAMVVAETGEAEMLAARGEIPYRPEIGRRYWYADLSGPGGSFGTLDFGEQPPALFLGKQVSLADLGLDVAAGAGQGQGAEFDPDAIVGPQVSVEAVTCGNCGGALEIHVPDRTERVACPYCGTMHDCHHGALSVVAAATQDPIKPDIPLGSKGTFDGAPYTVIGFMVRSTAWGWQTFSWNEYLLYNPAQGFRWLVHGDGHWNYIQPLPVGEVAARAPGHGHYPGEVAEHGGDSYKIFQSGEAKVEYVAGEFYWKVAAEQTAHTVDFVKPPLMLSGESSGNEVNWSLGTYKTHGEIAASFPDVDVPQSHIATVAPNQPFRHKGVYPVWGVFLVLAIAALIWATSSNSRQTVHSQSFTLEAKAPAAPKRPQSDTPGADLLAELLAENSPTRKSRPKGPPDSALFFTEPFELVGDKNIEISGRANVDNSWVYVQGDLYNKETGLVVAFDMPIEYYHGSDGYESWAEGSRVNEKYLSAVTGGSYILRVAVERSDSWVPVVVQIKVSQGISRLRYWMFALFFLSIIPLGVLVHHISFEKRRWSQSDYTGGDE